MSTNNILDIVQFGFWQEVAVNLRNQDAKSLRLICKKITAEVDASFLLNIHLYLTGTIIKKVKIPLMLERRLYCYVESTVRTIFYHQRHRSDTDTTFQPWIRAVERFKKTNTIISVKHTRTETKHYQLSQFLESNAINVTVRDDDSNSISAGNINNKIQNTLVHVLPFGGTRVYEVGEKVDFGFYLTGFNTHFQNVRRPISLKMKLPLARRYNPNNVVE